MAEGDSVLDKFGNLAGGFLSAGVETLGLAYDLAMSPLEDDEYSGVIGQIKGVTGEHLGSILENLIGPDRGLGAGFSLVPEEIRNPIAKGFEGVNYVRDEFISRPLAALITVGSVADERGGLAGLFNADNWRTAWDIADSRSPGQALALMATKNILDPDEVLQYQQTGMYKMVSASFDAYLAFNADVDVFGAKAFKYLRAENKLLGGGVRNLGRLRADVAADMASELRTAARELGIQAAERGDTGLISSLLNADKSTRKNFINRLSDVLNPPADYISQRGLTRQIDEYFKSARYATYRASTGDVARAIAEREGVDLADMVKNHELVGEFAARLERLGALGPRGQRVAATEASQALARSYLLDEATNFERGYHQSVMRVMMGDATEAKRFRRVAVRLHSAERDVTRAERVMVTESQVSKLLEDMVLSRTPATRTGGIWDRTASYIQKNFDEFTDDFIVDLYFRAPEGSPTRRIIEEKITDFQTQVNRMTANRASRLDLEAAAGRGQREARELARKLDDAAALAPEVGPPLRPVTGGGVASGASARAVESAEQVRERLYRLKAEKDAAEASAASLAAEAERLGKRKFIGGADETAGLEPLVTELTGDLNAQYNRAAQAQNFFDNQLGEITDYLFGVGGARVPDKVEQISKVPVATFTAEPRITNLDKLSYKATMQTSIAHKPIEFFAGMKPHKVIDHADDRSFVQVNRMIDSVKGLDDAERFKLKGLYSKAQGTRQRVTTYEEIESRMFEVLAEKAGMTSDDVHAVLQNIKVPRAVAYQQLQKARQFVSPDGTIRTILSEGDDIFPTAIPHLATQGGASTVTVDFRHLQKVLDRRSRVYKRFKDEIIAAQSEGSKTIKEMEKLAGGGYIPKFSQAVRRYEDAPWNAATRMLTQSAELVMSVWAPAVLLRPAWALRVVLMDEQMRMMANFSGQFSFMRQLEMRKVAWNNLVAEMASSANPFSRMIGLDKSLTSKQSLVRSTGVGAMFGYAATASLGSGGTALGVAGGAYLGRKAIKRMRQMEFMPYELGAAFEGATFQNAFGTKEDRQSLYLEKVSSANGEMLNALKGNIDGDYTRIRDLAEQQGKYVTVLPTDINRWGKDWMNNVNFQIGQDRMAKMVLEKAEQKLARSTDGVLSEADVEGIVDDLVSWLGTRPGKAHAKGLFSRTLDVHAKREWSAAVADMSLRYLSPNNSPFTANHALMKKVLEGKTVDAKEIIALTDNALSLPPMHGPELAETLGKQGTLARFLNTTVETGFETISRIPSDTLSRQPYFAGVYELEVKRLAKLHGMKDGVVDLSKADVAQIERQARKFALSETRLLMYELAEQSNFADLTRFIMPFFPAWQEALTRYAGIAVENPTFAARAVNLFTADIYQKDPETGDEYIAIRVPSWFKGLMKASIFKDAFDSVDTVRFNKASLNMISQGLPGFGPLAQIPIAEAAKQNPGLEDSLSFMFPYGVPTSTMDSLLPAWGRRAKSLLVGSDRAMASTQKHLIITKLVQMENGEIPWVDMNDPLAREKFLNDVKSEARNFMSFRLAASLIAPAAPSFDSPYKMFEDGYRQLRKEFGGEADRKFLEIYGEDFFALTQTFTKSLNGVPSTLDGIEKEERYGDLVTTYPELGGVITGSEGGGAGVKFIRSKYDAQFAEGARRDLSLSEVATSPSLRLSWTKFSQAMDQIEHDRIARGLPNLRVAEAKDLAARKRAIVQQIGEKDKLWLQAYLSVDQTSFDRRLEGLKAIAQRQGLGTPDSEGNVRHDLAPLNEYISMREAMMEMLDQRARSGGSGTLSSGSNADLAELWDNMVSGLVANNFAFADLYYRLLDNDPIRPTLFGASL